MFFKELHDERLRDELLREYYEQVTPAVVMVIFGFLIMTFMIWFEIKKDYLLIWGAILAGLTLLVLAHLLLAKAQKMAIKWQYLGFYFNTAVVGLGFGTLQAYHLNVVTRDNTGLLVLFIAGLILLGMKAFAHSPGVFWTLVAGSIGPELIYFYGHAGDLYYLTLAILTSIFGGLTVFLNWQDYRNKIKYYILNFNLADAKEEIEQAKKQQDGDYYLISLLVEPLVKKERTIGDVQVTSVLKQKKEFSFRGRDREIGGDINIVDEIVLKGKRYIALTNADAMGKSIQGAGGALVFGTIFNAILNRVKTREVEQSVTPSRWLVNTYRELEDIFASFDGRMNMSLIAGLVDEEGRFFFLNVEHPFIVLKRNGQVRFLEEKIHVARVGYGHEQHQRVDVRMVQMLRGDQLILGSDGRDDVVYDEAQGVSDDHLKILQVVKATDGDLDSMFKDITRQGRLTDDFSLVSIAFSD